MCNFYLNHAVTSVRKTFIVFSSALLWNSISIDLKRLTSLQLFKSKLIDDIIKGAYNATLFVSIIASVLLTLIYL